jgi:AcrR family transcriptional regulator
MIRNNQNNSKQRGQRALTRKGRHTREAILEAARDVFREQGYYQASVAEISRRAGMSQGSFYQYFKNKEQAFLELNDDILTTFWRKASRIDLLQLPSGERLPRVVALILEHARENYYYHRILGEFELIDPVTIGYFDSMARFLRGFFRREINDGIFRSIDPNVVSYGLLGSALFQAMDWGPDYGTFGLEESVEMTTRLLLAGINGPARWKTPKDPTWISASPAKSIQAKAPDEQTQGHLTRQALLKAAEKVFGQFGFNRAGIADITREAGVAQGTFYVHFKSKRDLMEGSVRFLSRQMRWTLKKATAGLEDRREVERVGFVSFFRFLAQHRQIYRVVAESETMGREMAMWYYKKLADGWAPGMASGVERGEIRDDLPPAFMTRSAMGIIHMIGLKWLVWNSSPQAELTKQVLEDTIILVLKGLQPA